MPKLVFQPEDNFKVINLANKLQETFAEKYEIQYPGTDWKGFDIILKKDKLNSVTFYVSKKKDGRIIIRYAFQSVGLLWRMTPLLAALVLPIGLPLFIYKQITQEKLIYDEAHQFISSQYGENLA